MITRKKRIGIDSSPKTAICKNIHLLSRETINDTVNLLKTPTRQTRFNNNKLNNANVNIVTDESPILSQEPVSITWKWANEGTPIRTNSKASKLRRSSEAKQKPNIEGENGFMNAMSSNLATESESNSPKGLYKFQEEMRKIQFDTESDMSCDNISSLNMSTTPTTDTGYPINVDTYDTIDRKTKNLKCHYNNNIDIDDDSKNVMNKYEKINYELVKSSEKSQMNVLNDSLANDLLNDSDFDQVLLTCTERAEMTVSESQPNVKKSNSTPEIKCSGSSSSDWNLFNDDVDDLLSNIDIDIPISENLNNSKFTRHKSMPQQQQKPVSTLNGGISMKIPNQHSSSIRSNVSRKSFTRHESFPIAAQNRFQKPYGQTSTITSNDLPGSNSVSTSASQRCTSEEIAEKRRQALERLKNRNKPGQMNMPPKR